MIMKKITTFISVLLASAAICSAQDSATPSVAMAFAAIPSDPAALAMGGNTALGSSMAWGAASNVSAVPFSADTFALEASYQMWQPSSLSGTNNVAAGTSVVLMDKLGISAAFAMDMSKPYDVFNANGNKVGQFTPSDMMVSFGASYLCADFLSVGLGAHYMRSALASDYAPTAFGVDVLATARISALNAVFGVKSLGTKVDGFYTPGSIVAAVGYHSTFAEDHAVKADAQLDYFLAGGMNVALGGEYTYAGLVSARAGYNLGVKGILPSFASVGLGVKVFGVSLNAAYLLGSEVLANTLTFGLGYSF